jgi:endoglucanase
VWPSATTPATNVVGPTTSWIGSDATGDTYVLDFSGFVTGGTYRVISNGFSSYPFRIGSAVYDVRVNDGLKFFEVQNSSSQVSWVSLDGTTGGHAPSHRDDARLGSNTDGGGGDRKLLNQPIPSGLSSHPNVTGGWYDAGDYGKYMGNTPWAVYNLLLTYEDSNAYWSSVDLNTNGQADILDHALVALNWMQLMVWSDGSVFERVFNGYNAPFDGHPDFETDQISGTADDRPLDSDRYADITAKSSYAFAVAARVFNNPTSLRRSGPGGGPMPIRARSSPRCMAADCILAISKLA